MRHGALNENNVAPLYRSAIIAERFSFNPLRRMMAPFLVQDSNWRPFENTQPIHRTFFLLKIVVQLPLNHP